MGIAMTSPDQSQQGFEIPFFVFRATDPTISTSEHRKTMSQAELLRIFEGIRLSMMKDTTYFTTPLIFGSFFLIINILIPGSIIYMNIPLLILAHFVLIATLHFHHGIWQYLKSADIGDLSKDTFSKRLKTMWHVKIAVITSIIIIVYSIITKNAM
jgi:hypothetical protein